MLQGNIFSQTVMDSKSKHSDSAQRDQCLAGRLASLVAMLNNFDGLTFLFLLVTFALDVSVGDFKMV